MDTLKDQSRSHLLQVSHVSESGTDIVLIFWIGASVELRLDRSKRECDRRSSIKERSHLWKKGRKEIEELEE